MAKGLLLTDIREMTDADIRTRIGDLELERFNLRFSGATKPLEDPLRLRAVRKDIARLNTVLRERTSPGRALTSSGK
jgi:large subunit ribosomal protein L29